MKHKSGKKTIKAGKNNFTMTPLEDYLHLQAMVSFELRSRQVGAYLIRQNKSQPWQLIFGFECEGIHSFKSTGEIEPLFDAIEAGVKDFPPGETVTFHLSAFKTDRERQAELDHLIASAPTQEIKFLLLGEKKRCQQLTGNGQREPKKLIIYCSYTFAGGGEGESLDWIDKALLKLESWLKQIQGVNHQAREIEQILRSGFNHSYLSWENLLATKLKLKVKPMTAECLWQTIWERFNHRTPVIPIPQLLTISEDDFRETINSQVHATTLLVADTVPKADRRWLYHKGNFTAALTFWDKPMGWKDKKEQLCYLGNLIARERVTDTEIICQISPANQMLVRTAMQKMIKQSRTAAEIAAQKGDIDVGSQLKMEQSIEAQKSLYEGAVPFYVGVIILTHRPTLEELDDASREIEGYFLRPAWVVREKEITWKLWLQTLPIVQEKLLASTLADRRLVLQNTELLGFAPLVNTVSPDQVGIELIAEDGGTPVKIDLFKAEGKHLGIFGITRSGKSVTVSGMLTHALARNIPVVALDYPKPDGTSTFTDYTNFLGELGAYFDVGKESVNLFERPNLSSLPGDLQQERTQEFTDFLGQCLLAMVVGDKTDEILKTTIRTVIYCCLTAFNQDEQIEQRYQQAQSAPRGTAQWNQVPTLKDFLPFCTLEKIQAQLNLEAGVNFNLVPQAIEQIRLRLFYWIHSRVGKAISYPSTIAQDSMLLVFALRQVSQAEDAAILSLVAYAAALRRALAFPKSLFFIDESPILFQFEEIAELVGMIFANGSKTGIRVILSAQDPDTIAQAQASAKILQNMQLKLIGRIAKNALTSFERIFHYPSEIISQCPGFTPNRFGIYSQWLLDYGGDYSFCRYYPAHVQLGAVANNTDEQLIRAKIMNRADNKYRGLAQFSQLLIQSMQSGADLESVYNRTVQEDKYEREKGKIGA
jgi:hypothetical protein